MQDPKHINKSRKPWYQRAIEMSTLWKLFSRSAEIPKTKPNLWKSISKPSDNSATNHTKHKLRKSTSLKVATSLTRACLCVPISSYTEVFQSEVVSTRRSYSYPSSKSVMSGKHEKVRSARISIEGRRIFRGKSLMDDVLMRRFVVEEEAMMQVRRRNQMEIIRKRTAMRRKRIGPSPLSRMVWAEE